MVIYSATVRFKEIKNHPGYFIGTDGTVWSTWSCIQLYRCRGSRSVSGGRWRQKWVWVRPRTGYVQVSLTKGRAALVHRLVAEAFLGPPPTPQHEVAHWDGVPWNNNLGNLRWATRSVNHRDKNRHGTMIHGESCNFSVLKNADVVQVVRMFAQGMGNAEIGKALLVSTSLIAQIRRGKSWSWLTGIGKAKQQPAIRKKHVDFNCSYCGVPVHGRDKCSGCRNRIGQGLPPFPMGRSKRKSPSVAW